MNQFFGGFQTKRIESDESGPHTLDISSSDVDRMLPVVDNPGRLKELIALSRKKIGFFPAHNPRCIEYPWVVDSVLADRGTRNVADIGAGLSAVPFALAAEGIDMTTVDSHARVRLRDDPKTWNEWGFLDYSKFDPTIRSFHEKYEEWEADRQFDCLTSVSVIEHLPAQVRRDWARKFARDLHSGGKLILTMDVVPNTQRLWNLSDHLEVDEPSDHGTLEDVASELKECGFMDIECEIKRKTPNCHLDTALMKAYLL